MTTYLPTGVTTGIYENLRISLVSLSLRQNPALSGIAALPLVAGQQARIRFAVERWTGSQLHGEEFVDQCHGIIINQARFINRSMATT